MEHPSIHEHVSTHTDGYNIMKPLLFRGTNLVIIMYIHTHKKKTV